MQREIRIFIIALFILNIFIQSLVNIFIFNDQSNRQSIKSHTTANKPYDSLESNTDLLNILTEINNKLDAQNQYLANNLGKNTHNQRNETSANNSSVPVQPDAKSLADYKYSLMNDMSRNDMNIATFLADPRLNSLPEQDKNEILTELTRRLDSGEINKATFLPGYKQK